MIRIAPHRSALLVALLAVAGCTSLQQPLVTTGDASGTGTGTASATASLPVAAAPAPKVASLAITPDSLELNAPYSYGGYQSETDASLSEKEVAGYPTTGRLWPIFLDAEGQRIPPAEIDWMSSNPELVMVDATGWVRSVDPGTSGMITITLRLKADPTILATASVVLRNDGKLSLELK